MASSPAYRATPEIPRPRSSYSVPAQSRDSDRSGTPGSSRGRLSFFNRSITPSIKSRPQSVAPEDPIDRITQTKRLASQGRLLQSWSQLSEKYKNIGLEDDEEIDLFSETVHRSDGSVGKCLDHYPRQGEGSDTEEEEDQSDGDSIQAGPSRHSKTTLPAKVIDDETESDDISDEDETSSDSASEDEEDEMGSWAVQEENFKIEQADKKAALLLSSLRSAPRKTKEEELAEFLRDEEIQRTRRMSARVEGRDSRCHTDALSDTIKSEYEKLIKVEERRTPSTFWTMITDATDDLFSESESGEDELAVASSEINIGSKMKGSEDSESSDMEEKNSSRRVIGRARQPSTHWTTDGSSSNGPLRISLSPDSSPEPIIVSERILSKTTSSHAAHRQSTKEHSSESDHDVTSSASVSRREMFRAKVIGSTLANKPTGGKPNKVKGRMVDESLIVLPVADVFGPTEAIDTATLDRRRYHRNRYRQKASQSFKTCRYCRLAEGARAKLAEYCRGANHSKQCTFEFPPKNDERNKFWKDDIVQTDKPVKADLASATDSASTAPARTKRSGRTSGGLEKWRYYENLVKRSDKQTNRSCPYCRSSRDVIRYENAVYCRGRIESKDCTFEGHKGSLRLPAKTKTPKHAASEPAKPVSSVTQTTTPKTPSPVIINPDMTVDEDQLDLKKYYASLIRDQFHTGYRFCADCTRSGDADRRRLSFWCRGRISYKACSYWDGDESQHRRKRRQSAPDGHVDTTDRPEDDKHAITLIQETTIIPPDEDANPPPPPTTFDVDNTKHARSVTSVATLYYPEVHKLGHGGVMHCKPCTVAGGRRKSKSAYCRGRTSSSRCLFNLVADPAEESEAKVEPAVKKRGRLRKSLEIQPGPPPVTFEASDTPPAPPIAETKPDEEKQEAKTLKRKRGRPQSTASLLEVAQASLVAEPTKRKSRKPKSVPTSDDEEHQLRRMSERPDAAEANISPVIVKRKAGRPKSHSVTYEDIKNVDLVTSCREADQSELWPGRGPAGLKPHHLAPRPRARSRTFDIVVPVSRSITPGSSPTVDTRNRSRLAVPVSSMRNNDNIHLISPPRLDTGTRRIIDELPPSSPPASPSPSASPRPIRHLPYRSSPLASTARSSNSRSETPSMPIKGILRQSSEFSDAPRSNKRARFSLMRSPSPIVVSSDSESSDDELLLVGPSSSSRRSAPPSSRRQGSSSPFGPESRFVESPQTGRLSSSMLAAYAPTLDRLPTLGSASSSLYIPPHSTIQRSTLSSPPINAGPAPTGRGMMLPPPVPHKVTPTPHSEPRARGAILRAHTVGPSQRPRSFTLSAKSSDRPVAQNMVIRRLIDDVR